MEQGLDFWIATIALLGFGLRGYPFMGMASFVGVALASGILGL